MDLIIINNKYYFTLDSKVEYLYLTQQVRYRVIIYYYHAKYMYFILIFSKAGSLMWMEIEGDAKQLELKFFILYSLFFRKVPWAVLERLAAEEKGFLIRQSPLFPGSNLTHISRFTKAHKMLPAC